jgi:hypothetical protein
MIKKIKNILTSIVLILSMLPLGAQQLSIGLGANWVSTGAVTLSEGIDLNVDGTINNKGGSRINFYGNAAQDIKGNATPTFSDIYLNNSGTGIRLYTDISMSGTLTMTDGNFDMLDQTFTLGQNGDISGENSNSSLIASDGSGSYGNNADAGDGHIVRTIDITTSGVSNVGGMGINITPTANWGSCQVSRSHQRTVGVDDDNSIFRKFTITPTNAADLSASVSISYNSNELNGYTSGSLKMYQLKNNGAKGIEWQELASTDNGSVVSANSIDNSETELTLTLANTDKVLPINLLDFNSYCDNGYTRLQWHTASELNNDYFILEKSLDGENYEVVVQLSGQGTTNTLSEYYFVDYNSIKTPVYYRLSQVDYNGSIVTFSPIVSHCGLSSEINFSVVNPVSNQIHIFSDAPLNTVIEVSLIDVWGRLIFNKRLNQNENEWFLPVETFSSGLYYLRFSSENYLNSKSITILNN